MATAAARATSLLTRRGALPQQLLAGLQRRGLASLGGSEVSISMLAAPVTKADLAGSSKGTEGVGMVTAVGSNVKAVGVNDWVVPAAGGALGTCPCGGGGFVGRTARVSFISQTINRSLRAHFQS